MIASCPKLAPISHHTFGDTVSALQDLYAQYYRCQTAALGGQEPK